MSGATDVRVTAIRKGVAEEKSRHIPDEVPVAFSYAGSTHAVMMATPADLEDFAFGFSLTEGIVSSLHDIVAVRVLEHQGGYDAQIELVSGREEQLRRRRRFMAGPVGCGLCGVDSIDQALRPVPELETDGPFLSGADVVRAMASMGELQPLYSLTRAVHGAGFYVPGEGMILAREDVGRHNAVDKLCGAMLRQQVQGRAGALVITSRVSVEIVQKAAMAEIPVIIAISAPTRLAVDTAHEAGLTLVAVARGEDYEIFSHEARILLSDL